MRGSKAKALRQRADELIVDWLRNMVPEGEDVSRINTRTIDSFLPEDTHFYANGQVRLYYMSRKWVRKHLKRNPDMTLTDLINAETA